MIRIASISMLLLVLAGSPTSAQDSSLWRLVAQSDVIVVGVPEALSEPLPARDYVELELDIAQTLKGDAGQHPRIWWFSEPRDYAPSAEQIRVSSGTPSLVFAVLSEGRSYFAGNTSTALRTADAGSVADTRAEIGRQAELLTNWQTSTDAPHYEEVQAIIEAIATLPPASRDERRSGTLAHQRLFDRLIALGPEAVPAIIEQMDDRRALANPTISLVNHSPNAFEGIRHYGPKVMVDALAAVLNQLTGESFGFIYNGGTTPQRDAAVRGWRIYLDHIRKSSNT
ncbi:hypothetical protein [Brevundimonas sp.]